ncbi:hypothetical protein FUAX_49330 (plasmid) [Fulvitalea axinellae]|uniref:Uncharacterized protein n=1 Tax=Fulvitalea axinellae TaxID=1182444 RepID=A0AAU9CKB8_9BACT|nr:hypothetical protein FUAX_49330 [Fulvitalea axinellae]
MSLEGLGQSIELILNDYLSAPTKAMPVIMTDTAKRNACLKLIWIR